MRTLIVQSLTAGARDLDSAILREAVLRAGAGELVYQKKDERDLGEARRCDLVVIAGGDGTVAKILGELPEPRPPVALVPSGTANNIATSLGLDTREDALNVIGASGRRRLDLGSARWGKRSAMFVEGAGLGPLVAMLDADIDADGCDKIEAGRRAYRDAVRAAEPIEAEIVLDGEPLEGAWLAAEFLNVGFTGPNLPLASGADTGDGAFDLVLLPPEMREAMCDWAVAPGHSHAPVRRTRVRSALVRGQCAFRLDDESCRLGVGETLKLGFAGSVEVAVHG